MNYVIQGIKNNIHTELPRRKLLRRNSEFKRFFKFWKQRTTNNLLLKGTIFVRLGIFIQELLKEGVVENSEALFSLRSRQFTALNFQNN